MITPIDISPTKNDHIWVYIGASMGSKASIMPRPANLHFVSDDSYESSESDASVDADYYARQISDIHYLESKESDATSESGGANDDEYEVHSIRDIRINMNNQVSIQKRRSISAK